MRTADECLQAIGMRMVLFKNIKEPNLGVLSYACIHYVCHVLAIATQI